MKITSDLFEAFLKCATKCHLRSLGETSSGNEYPQWVHTQDESYQREAARRLQESVPEVERVARPLGGTINVTGYTAEPMRNCVPSDRGRKHD